MVKLLDCTTRDGGYCTNWNYSDEYIFGLMSTLNKNKINFYEIGYRNYYDKNGKGAFYYCTPDLIKKFYDKKGDLNLGVMVDTKRYNESDFLNAKEDYIDFVRIATHPDRIKDTLLIAENLYNKNYNVMVQLMDITNLTQGHFSILNNWQNKSILKVLYLADTYGIINAEDLGQVYSKIKEMGYKNIGFHAHNKTHQALTNSIHTIKLGAYSIDVVQDVNGINGGNLSYNEFYLNKILEIA
ncbi:hypothetical protein IKQ21_05395 [bacterium]|nr:hypothetical protein [bacterium]